MTELHRWRHTALLLGSEAPVGAMSEQTKRENHNSPEPVEEVYSFPERGSPELHQVPQKSASTGNSDTYLAVSKNHCNI